MEDDKEELGRLLKQRGRMRAAATKFLNKVGTVENSLEVQGILDGLTRNLNGLDTINSSILGFLPDEDVDTDLDESINYELRIKKGIEELKAFLNKSKIVSAPAGQLDKSGTVKLPKLQLPTFSGNRLEFHSFWDLFQAAIIKNRTLSDVQKFAYLKTSLAGEAKDAIGGLMLTGANLEVAVDILIKRFGSKDTITRGHLRKLQEIRSPSQSVRELRRFYDEILLHVRSLQNLCVANSSFEVLLLPNLISKLPEQMKLDILDKSYQLFAGKLDTLDKFMDLLLRIIEIREEARDEYHESYKGSRANNSSSENDYRSGGQNVSESSVSALSSQSSKVSRPGNLTNQKKPNVCIYCLDNHHNVDCPKLSSIADRVAFLKRERRCFSCLKTLHGIRNCRIKKQCPNCIAPQFHHTSICTKRSDKGGTSSVVAECIPANSAQTLSLQSSWTVSLPTAKVVVLSPDGNNEILVKAILDTASNRTYIRNDICTFLGIPTGNSEVMKLNTFGTTDCSEFTSRSVVFRIKRPRSDDVISLSGYTADEICKSQPSVNVENCRHLQELELADPLDLRDTSMETGILIGADFYYDIVYGTQIIRDDFGPVAVGSRLGWLIQGRVSQIDRTPEFDSGTIPTMTLFCTDMTDGKHLKHQLQSFWELEHLGIRPDELEEAPFLKNTKFENNRYVVPLPWKTEKHKLTLPTNFSNALRRLQSVRSHLRRNPGVLEEYEAIFKNQCKLGIIEQVFEKSVNDNDSVVHYLPHGPVIRPDAISTKLRVVFDASAHGKCTPSINACMNQGPCSLPQIPLLLISFRLHKVAFIADLEKAFHQVKIAEEDRDCLRFLWMNLSSSELQHYRHVSLVFGLTCSPAVLEHVINLHLQKYKTIYPAVVSKLETDMYVDNITSGCDTLEEACDFFVVSRKIFQEAGFNLRQWMSNSKDLLHFISDSGQSVSEESESMVSEDLTTFSDLTLNYSSEVSRLTKVLGLQWNVAADIFVIDNSGLANLFDPASGHLTKRNILQITARIYDPLGLLSPLLVLPKLLFQKLCSDKNAWDSPVSEDIVKKWKVWFDQICELRLSVPRLLVAPHDIPSILELHGFSDASMDSYACAVYLRCVYANGNVTTSLVMARSRVASKRNPQTIPRLELMAATILSRLMVFLKDRFCMAKLFCWTDSRNVLQWIRAEHKVWSVFVQNRVLEIRKNMRVDVWNHVPGEMNPADLPSRGVSPTGFESNRMWWDGPQWLRLAPSEWPPQALDENTAVICMDEEESFHGLSLATSSLSYSIRNVIPLNKFSSYVKLIKVTAYVKRFVEIMKGNKPSFAQLTTTDILEAEILWIKDLQGVEYKQELSHLKNGSRRTTLTQNLRLFLDSDGLIRCKGRMSSVLLENTNCPILLPRDSEFMRLIIWYSHIFVAHGGVSMTLCKIRERFWLLKGRQQIKKVLRQCHWCKRIQGLPYTQNMVPDLPDFRIKSVRAFHTVGLDYCGPLYYRSNGGADKKKCYVCLFTCATTRALHLELVPDLTTESFLRALRRFVSRRGIPKIVSDNAKTFKSAFKQLKATSDSDMRVTEEPVPSVQLNLQENLKYRKNLLNRFWDEWKRSYLLSLREKGIKYPRGTSEEPKVGDVVILTEEKTPRLRWKIGKITELKHGRDDAVRSAMVKVRSERKELRRPVRLLVPIESERDNLSPHLP